VSRVFYWGETLEVAFGEDASILLDSLDVVREVLEVV
jgi:hypothetical protein